MNANVPPSDDTAQIPAAEVPPQGRDGGECAQTPGEAPTGDANRQSATEAPDPTDSPHPHGGSRTNGGTGPADGPQTAGEPHATDEPHPTDAPRPTPSRRRRRVRRIVKGVAALGVVVAFLAVADRWAVLYAEDLAAEQVRDTLDLRAAPEVHIDSFPFALQLATGDLDRVEVNIPDLAAGPVSIAQVRATVDDIRIVGSLPGSVEGADLGSVRGDVFLGFDDLTRELGASQVTLEPGPGRNTVRAQGRIPVAGSQVDVRSNAQVRRTGDRGVELTVADTRLVVPGVLTYTPGKGGGLQLAGAATKQVDDAEFEEATGERPKAGRLLKGKALDALVAHPKLLEPAGVDPALLEGLQQTREPKVAEAMEFSAELPDDMPGDLGLRSISVTKDGIRAKLTGTDVPVR